MLNNYLQETRKTLWLGLPFIANQLLQIAVVTIDSMMAGADGELTLAAVAQGASLFTMMELILIGLAMPLTPMFARSFVKKDYDTLRELFHQGVWLSVLLSILGVFLMLGSPLLMYLAGVDALIIPPATQYLWITAAAMPFFALYLPVRFFNEGIANPKVVMMITGLSLPINVAGNYIFLNGFFGVPKMGAAGIALSTVFSTIFICVLGWWYIKKHHSIRQYGLFDHFTRPVGQTIMRLIRIGAPNAVALLMEAGMFTCVALLSGRLGVTIAAANQIAFSYISIIFMIPLGLSLAVMTRIGMASADEDLNQARVIGVSGMIVGAGVMLISAMAISFVGQWVAELYTTDTDVIDIAVGLLALAALFQIPDGIQVCVAGALRGLEETKAPMQYAIIGYWVFAVPLAILLAFYFQLSARGLWIGMLIGLSFTAVLGVRKFLKLTQ